MDTFGRFLAQVRIGDSVVLTLANNRELSGSVRVLSKNHVELDTAKGEVSLLAGAFAQLVLMWEKVDAGSREPEQVPVVAPQPALYGANGESLERREVREPSRIASFVQQPQTRPEPRQEPNKPVVATEDSRLVELETAYRESTRRAVLRPLTIEYEFPAEAFAPEIRDEAKREWVRWTNQYDYACKVRELSRLYPIVGSLQVHVQKSPHVGTLGYNLGCLLMTLSRQPEALVVFEAAYEVSQFAPAALNAAVAALQTNQKAHALGWLSRYCITPRADVKDDPWYCLVRLADELQAHDIWESMLEAIIEGTGSPTLREPILEALAYRHRRANRNADAVNALTRRYLPQPEVRDLLVEYQGLGGASFGPVGEIWRAYRAEQQAKLDRKLTVQSHETAIVNGRTVKEIKREAGENAARGQYGKAITQLEEVLAILPDDPTILGLLAAYRDKAKVNFVRSQPIQRTNHSNSQPASGIRRPWKAGMPSGKGPFARAKQAHLQDKDHARAEELFREAIRVGDNAESAVKDLVSLLQQTRQYLKAVEVINENRSKVHNDLWVFTTLSGCYLRIENYTEAIASLQSLRKVQQKPEKRNTDRRIALCHLKKGDRDKAEELLESLLREDPDDLTTKRTLEAIREARTAGEGIPAGMFSQLFYRLSPMLEFFLGKCEYHGLRADEREHRQFSEDTITRLTGLIRSQGKGRPAERAPSFLTAARVLRDMGSDGTEDFHGFLCRYSAAMGTAAAADPKRTHDPFTLDVVRSFYLEAFTVDLTPNDKQDEDYKVIRYMLSYVGTRQEIAAKPAVGEDALIVRAFQTGAAPNGFWHGMLGLSVASARIAEQLLPRFFDNRQARDSALSFLKDYTGVDGGKVTTLGQFAQRWHQARQQRYKEYEECLQAFRVQQERGITTDELAGFSSVLQKLIRSHSRWLFSVDEERIVQMQELVSQLDQFCRQTAFEEREYCLLQIQQTLDTRLLAIETHPTRLGIEALYPLLEDLRGKVTSALNNLLHSAQPRVTVTLEIEDAAPDINRVVPLRLKVSNLTGSSPISNIELTLVPESQWDVPVEEVYRSPESIRGSGERTVACQLRLTPDTVAARVVPFEVKLAYQDRRKERIEASSERLSLKLYDRNEFEPINNPFSRFANGVAVDDREMFKGRDEIINRIVGILSAGHKKCFVLYGQKRSGKSSVMYHLQQELNKADGRFLCATMSAGILDLEKPSIADFLYNILSAINTEVDTIKDRREPVPPFQLPSYRDFESSPNLMFLDTISRFRSAFRDVAGWENRQIVLTIDEFTYLYPAMKLGRLPGTFLQTWKALLEKGLFSAVLVGQDIMPKFMEDYPNEFAMMACERLTYLNSEATRQLIEEPILIHSDPRETRFRGKIYERVRDLTAGNPFYIQLLGDRLVEHLNQTHSVYATTAEIDAVVQDLVRGENSLGDKHFDNLVTAGDREFAAISAPHTRSVLYEIAKGSVGAIGCHSTRIQPAGVTNVAAILQDLQTREVVEIPQEGYYRIRVGLFRDWLLAHPHFVSEIH